MLRAVLVGPPVARDALRRRLDAAFAIVAEAASLAEARQLDVAVDAIVLAPAAHPEPAPVEHLTDRELDVMDLLSQGLTNRAIAARLGISDQTVKFHVASLSAKLGAANRTDAVRRAIRHGLISL